MQAEDELVNLPSRLKTVPVTPVKLKAVMVTLLRRLKTTGILISRLRAEPVTPVQAEDNMVNLPRLKTVLVTPV